jgi:HD-GYP domain-containing protein (c-di-GMP phosphodiesterase class II)
MGTGEADYSMSSLKHRKIPFLARILSVADVYDAMASDRAYRKKMEDDVIIKIINDGVGTQFDPDIVAAFNKVCQEGKISHYMQTVKIN